MFEDGAEVCFNCKHKWKMLCTLFDELVEDNCTCFMYSNDKKKIKR